jgi:hypothetical protein
MTRLVFARTPRPATRSGSRQVHSERKKQIMNKKELLKKVYEASSAETARYLTDDFQATFANGNPSMDKDTWIGMGVLMEAAMPDMVWEFDYIGEDGDDVLVDTRMSGTFENDLDLSALGMGVIPATGKRVEMGPIRDRVRFEDGKICEIHDPQTGQEGGPTDLMKALGVETA